MNVEWLGKTTKGVQLSRENSEGRVFRVCLELGMQKFQLTFVEAGDLF